MISSLEGWQDASYLAFEHLKLHAELCLFAQIIFGGFSGHVLSNRWLFSRHHKLFKPPYLQQYEYILTSLLFTMCVNQALIWSSLLDFSPHVLPAGWLLLLSKQVHVICDMWQREWRPTKCYSRQQFLNTGEEKIPHKNFSARTSVLIRWDPAQGLFSWAAAKSLLTVWSSGTLLSFLNLLNSQLVQLQTGFLTTFAPQSHTKKWQVMAKCNSCGVGVNTCSTCAGLKCKCTGRKCTGCKCKCTGCLV